ncbi:hypothetical protein Q7P37_007208 [Cladosporium fusiforme]
MLAIRLILASLLLLLETNGLAIPADRRHDNKPVPELKPKMLVDLSKISTDCNKIGMWPWYNKYEIFAESWGLSEEEVKRVVKKAGAMTGWKYKEWGTSPEGVPNAMINFNLDIARTSRLEKLLTEALGLDPDSDNAVKCKASGAGNKS